jgi:hypothetical protein
MNEYFNRYKYHHNILKFLVEKDKEFSKSKDVKKPKNVFTHFEIAEIFKISDEKSLEILTELSDDNSIIFSKPNRYIAGDKGYKNIKSNKFKHISYNFNRDFLIKNIKDYLLIIVSVLSIITFFNNIVLYDKVQKENKKQLKSLILMQEKLKEQVILVKELQLKNQKNYQDSVQ